MHTFIPATLLGVTLVAFAFGSGDQQPKEITLTPAAPSQTTIDTQQLAQAYADERGMASCGAPADAELDDVFLTVPADPATGEATSAVIEPVGLDTALDSAGKRVVLLACSN